MNQTIELKVLIKTCANHAKNLRLEEKKSLGKARLFKEVGNRELEEAVEKAVKDLAKSEGFYSLYQNLRHQRVHQIRKEARHLQIAYAFLRGRDYIELEETCYQNPDWSLVEKNVFSFVDDTDCDPRIIKQNLERWIQEGRSAHTPEVQVVAAS